MSLAFMLGGLAIVPFNREFLGAAQLLMSGSMASCYILCYTIACMPAYRDGTSSAAMCAVMRLIVISEALFITQSGVRAHLSRIYKKVEVHSQEELVRALEGR